MQQVYHFGTSLSMQTLLENSLSNTMLVSASFGIKANITAQHTSIAECQMKKELQTSKRGRKKKVRSNERQPKGDYNGKESNSSEISRQNSVSKLKKEPVLNYLSKKISKHLSGEESGQTLKRTRRTWSKQEDENLIEQVKLHGLNWGLISFNMGGSRTGKQVRDRYLNKLSPSIKNSKWTEAEDQQLLQLFKIHGRKWCEIAKRMSGRTETKVKNRFYSQFKEYLSKNIQPEEPNAIEKQQEQGISNLPREPANYSNQALNYFLSLINRPMNFQNFMIPRNFFINFNPSYFRLPNGIDQVSYNEVKPITIVNQPIPLETATTRSQAADQMDEEPSFIDFSLPNRNKYDLFEDEENKFRTSNEPPLSGGEEAIWMRNFKTETEKQDFVGNTWLGN